MRIDERVVLRGQVDVDLLPTKYRIAFSRSRPMSRQLRPAGELTRGVDVFRDLAPAYDSWFESALGSFVAARQLAGLEGAVSPMPARSRIVEVGAGTGQVAAFLSARDYQVVAVEPAAEMLRAGRRRTGGRTSSGSARLPRRSRSRLVRLMLRSSSRPSSSWRTQERRLLRRGARFDQAACSSSDSWMR